MSAEKTYYVTYAITREETYCVLAANEADAATVAFDEGVFIGMGETLKVDRLTTKEKKGDMDA